ncbi:MAG: peptide MFS transporter [Leptospira sp.]|nr:peptide MFS transporter [Leptospira sp.]
MEKQNQKTIAFKNHPKGLVSLFLTEMWERTSYYGMRALLVLYLVKELHFSDEKATEIYGLYTSFVYLTPVIGGFLADKFLGQKRSIYLGSLLMLCGHLSLALPKTEFFYLGLVLLVLGNGFFKPNMSALVGRLYEHKPELRDSGYTIFYMGINVGGLIGPIICGSLGERINWHFGFGAAGIGMAIGILIFYLGSKTFPSEIWESSSERAIRKNEDDANNKYKIGLILILSIFSILFWMAFEQMGSSMNLFADRYTDREIFGWQVPASFFQSINPLFILCLAPLVAILWDSLAKYSIQPDPILKFVMSLFFLGLGFLVMVFAARENAEGVIFSSIWFLFGAYFWNTMSELFLSPVGLSFVSSTAPSKFAGMLMGIWFLSNAFGHLLAGYLAGYFGKMENLADFFTFFVISSWLGAILLLAIWTKIAKWMHYK